MHIGRRLLINFGSRHYHMLVLGGSALFLIRNWGCCRAELVLVNLAGKTGSIPMLFEIAYKATKPPLKNGVVYSYDLTTN